jgi:hypothetical protein
MPKGWFFEIHEDTPEQDAANLMEHSASVLDISSDDDLETKQHNEERGKENIPPSDFLAAQQARQRSADPILHGEQASAPIPTDQHIKLPRLRNITQDAMDEDRRPLGDLPAAEFYADGCDAGTYVTVDAGLERPSGLSKEFEFDRPTPEETKDRVVAVPREDVESTRTKESIQMHPDEDVTPQEEVTPLTNPATETKEVLGAAP